MSLSLPLQSNMEMWFKVECIPYWIVKARIMTFWFRNELDTDLRGYYMGIIPATLEQIDTYVVVLVPCQNNTKYANRIIPVGLGNLDCNDIDRVSQPMMTRGRDLVDRFPRHTLSCKIKASTKIKPRIWFYTRTSIDTCDEQIAKDGASRCCLGIDAWT